MTPPASTDADRRWLAEAVALSRCCPPSQAAYSVGAVIVGGDGALVSTGYSRETGPADHAEEVALARAGQPGAPGLAAVTLYSSLEPCAVRSSHPVSCADLIIAAGVRRVVIAWTEPPLLAPGGGAARLAAAGVAVTQLGDLADVARAVNAHLLAG